MASRAIFVSPPAAVASYLLLGGMLKLQCMSSSVSLSCGLSLHYAVDSTRRAGGAYMTCERCWSTELRDWRELTVALGCEALCSL